MAKPFITANQVTLARLLLLPVGSWLMYQGRQGQIIALIFMTLVGCTDFVDGWLARKYGPTVLGGLMDPIADKVFIVVVFLPFVDLGWLPAWLVALMLLREFGVTGLRSAYERRGLKLQSNFLGKVKTWAQMVGAAVLFLLGITSRQTMLWIFILGTVLPFLGAVIRYLRDRYVWRGALVGCAWFLGTGLVFVLSDWTLAGRMLMLSMLAVTWISGWVYISQSRRLFNAAPLTLGDAVRIGGAFLLPLVLMGAQVRVGPPSLAVIITMSLEMAVGGLDNLLCHHRAESSALLWGGRVGLVLLCYGLAMVAGAYGHALEAAGCFVSLLGTAAEFARGSNYYLDKKLQEKPLT